jgi:hypothetical protein
MPRENLIVELFAQCELLFAIVPFQTNGLIYNHLTKFLKITINLLKLLDILNLPHLPTFSIKLPMIE